MAIGWVMAQRHNLAVGDSIDLMGHTFRIVGTTSDAFMASFVFMTHAGVEDPNRGRSVAPPLLARSSTRRMSLGWWP